MGADGGYRSVWFPLWHFNPRPPCGGRLRQLRKISVQRLFQSTAPVWGPTFRGGNFLWFLWHFNPRPPCGGRRCGLKNIRREDIISIHGPRVGADQAFTAALTPLNLISIHGPRVGADPPVVGGGYYYVSISIHGPRVGADSRPTPTVSPWEGFQSTAPVWGPTKSGRPPGIPADFNPRPPCGGRQRRELLLRVPFISIHGPRVGADSSALSPAAVDLLFQSTAPVWGPTRESAQQNCRKD